MSFFTPYSFSGQLTAKAHCASTFSFQGHDSIRNIYANKKDMPCQQISNFCPHHGFEGNPEESEKWLRALSRSYLSENVVNR
jgi:hypothetical protein